MIPVAPRVISHEVAAIAGITEAIVLGQLNYWLSKSAKKHDGKMWVFNTYEQWQEELPYVSTRTIRRAISNLENLGFLITKQLDKHKYNQKKYYTIDYEKVNLMCSKWTDGGGQIGQMDLVNLDNSIHKGSNKENLHKGTSLVNSTGEQEMSEYKEAASEGIENLQNLLLAKNALPPTPPPKLKTNTMATWWMRMCKFYHKDASFMKEMPSEKDVGLMKQIIEKSDGKAVQVIKAVVVDWTAFKMRASALTGKTLPNVPSNICLLEHIGLALEFQEEMHSKPVQLIAPTAVKKKITGKKGW